MKTRIQCIRVGLLCLAATVSIGLCAQTRGGAALPAKAQAAVENGVSAAKQAQWDAAIRYFNEARQAAPESPVPLSNLGLAESQLPGHELRAICWFEAYLALVPNAANAPAVHQQITILKTRVQGNADTIIAMLKQLAGQMPASDFWAKWHAYPAIAALVASGGDLAAANQIADSQSDAQAQTKSRAHEQIVESLVNSKRIADALKEASRMPAGSDKQAAYNSIGGAQIAAGDFENAKQSIQQMDSNDQKRQTLALIEAECRTGKRGDAANLLGSLRISIDKNSDMDLREAYLAEIAATEYKIDLREESDALLQQIKSYLGNLTGKDKDSHRGYTQNHLAVAYDDTGRHSEALEYMKEAEKSCAIAQKQHEESVLIMSCEYMLWNANLYHFHNFDGAEWILKHLLNDKYYTPEIRQRWRDELNTAKAQAISQKAEAAAKAVQAASLKTLSDAGASPLQRAQAWENYLQACLNAPLYNSDFKTILAALPNFVPQASDPAKSQTIFDHVMQPATDLLASLNDVHELAYGQSRLPALDDDFVAHKSDDTALVPPPASSRP